MVRDGEWGLVPNDRTALAADSDLSS